MVGRQEQAVGPVPEQVQEEEQRDRIHLQQMEVHRRQEAAEPVAALPMDWFVAWQAQWLAPHSLELA